MSRLLAQKRALVQGGYILVAAMALVMMLLATGLAFMRWGTDEAAASAQIVAGMQAYYLGQMGVVEQGLTWLRGRQASDLPIGEIRLPGKTIEGLGSYSEVLVYGVTADDPTGNFFAQTRRYRIECVGSAIARMPGGGPDENHRRVVYRKAVLYVSVRNFADYLYLTGNEVTPFGEVIKFWHGDTLDGRVHSNSRIAIMQDPVFYNIVSSTAHDFWQGAGYAPHFLGGEPIFDAPAVELPLAAERLREGASAQGNYMSPGPDKTIRAHFRGSIVDLYTWDTGTPFDSSDITHVPISNYTCIFCDTPLEIGGPHGDDSWVNGECTIGASGIIRIMNNVRYSCANVFDGRFDPLNCDDYLGIVSERDVKIANTPANGRENSNGLGNAQSNQNLTSIVIDAAIVALGESFTFENQNDPDSGYVCNCAPDDRGKIYLTGSVTQARRGYVHRSNQGSTGYLKQYKYDGRLSQHRPPCFFDAEDELGHALFNIVQWGQGVENRLESARVRYN